MCYYANGQDSLECDRKLYNKLKGLDPDPGKWGTVPSTMEDLDYAKRYRRAAILLFWLKIKNTELNNAYTPMLENPII
jgi:hypothetical protein